MPSSPSGFVYDASRGSDRGGGEGGQKEDQGRGGVRKREQRNEELSRAAANSREIPWQSSVCTRERVSNEIDSRRRRRRQSEDAVSTCEAHSPPSPRKIGCGATNCTSLVRVFDRSICWICVRCVRKYMNFLFSTLDRRNRVKNFFGNGRTSEKRGKEWRNFFFWSDRGDRGNTRPFNDRSR